MNAESSQQDDEKPMNQELNIKVKDQVSIILIYNFIINLERDCHML